MGSENPVPAGSLDGLQGTGRPLAGKPGDLISDTGPGSIVSLFLGSEPLILICRVEPPTPLSTEDIEGKHQGLANAKWGFVNCVSLASGNLWHFILLFVGAKKTFSKGQNLQMFWLSVCVPC